MSFMNQVPPMQQLPQKFRDVYAIGSGGIIGVLGGLIGLGGAEFRLPLLVGVFRYRLLLAIVINLVVSFVTVCASLVFRVGFQHLDSLFVSWPIALNILGGSLAGSFFGVHFATRMPERVLAVAVAGLLVFLSAILIGHDWLFEGSVLTVSPPLRLVLGLLAGFFIGAVSSMLGVAGGELIIPTLVLLFALDIKQAGSVSLAISVPTILVGLTRYRSRPVFAEVPHESRFIVCMALGSILGAWIGSRLLPYVTGPALQIFLGIILLISAVKMAAKHRAHKSSAPI
jgi:uncharacterized membrane protein YfcA